jgi:hypothetical protein
LHFIGFHILLDTFYWFSTNNNGLLVVGWGAYIHTRSWFFWGANIIVSTGDKNWGKVSTFDRMFGRRFCREKNIDYKE